LFITRQSRKWFQSFGFWELLTSWSELRCISCSPVVVVYTLELQHNKYYMHLVLLYSGRNAHSFVGLSQLTKVNGQVHHVCPLLDWLIDWHSTQSVDSRLVIGWLGDWRRRFLLLLLYIRRLLLSRFGCACRRQTWQSFFVAPSRASHFRQPHLHIDSIWWRNWTNCSSRTHKCIGKWRTTIRLNLYQVGIRRITWLGG